MCVCVCVCHNWETGTVGQSRYNVIKVINRQQIPFVSKQKQEEGVFAVCYYRSIYVSVHVIDTKQIKPLVAKC
jgi:hypothetical protein